MGDRANVLIRESQADSGVYLYTHWSGWELPVALHQALALRERWDDCQYLGRIIFCAMIGDDTQGTTGFGISSIPGDGQRNVLTVNVQNQEISFGEKRWTFSEYASLTDSELGEVWSN